MGRPDNEIRYYIEPETGDPHIFVHNVSEGEVAEVLQSPLEDRPGRDGARVTIGRTSGGRFLKVIYVPDIDSDFVVTAYDLRGKPLMAFRRRMKRKNK